MNDEQLLLELEDILRNTPPQETIHNHTAENFSWLGRLAAALEAWNFVKGGYAKADINNIQDGNLMRSSSAFRRTQTVIHQAIHDLRMKTIGPLSVSISNGGVFDYFDEIRKILESASIDAFIIDLYLDAEFVSRYLPNIKAGVSIRLLAREKLNTLIPAIEAYKKQHQQPIEVRSDKGFHDRYIFIDSNNCYQSGASFKDGAKKSPTTVTQITDAFDAMLSTYEGIWSNASLEIWK